MNIEYLEAGRKKLTSLLLALAVSAMLTLLLISVLAFIMLKTEKMAEITSMGTIVISMISCFAGGFFCGKRNQKKKFMWGLAAGILYFLLLAVIRVSGGDGNTETAVSIITSLLYCGGSGMLGGMFS